MKVEIWRGLVIIQEHARHELKSKKRKCCIKSNPQMEWIDIHTIRAYYSESRGLHFHSGKICFTFLISTLFFS